MCMHRGGRRRESHSGRVQPCTCKAESGRLGIPGDLPRSCREMCDLTCPHDAVEDLFAECACTAAIHIPRKCPTYGVAQHEPVALRGLSLSVVGGSGIECASPWRVPLAALSGLLGWGAAPRGGVRGGSGASEAFRAVVWVCAGLLPSRRRRFFDVSRPLPRDPSHAERRASFLEGATFLGLIGGKGPAYVECLASPKESLAIGASGVSLVACMTRRLPSGCVAS